MTFVPGFVVINEQRNLAYNQLADQIRIESKVFRVRGTHLDFLMTLVCDFLFKQDEYETALEEANDKLKKTSPSLENITEFSILLKLAKKNSFLEVPIDKVREVISEAINSNAYPLSAKGTILFLIRDVTDLRRESGELNKLLISHLEKLLKDRKFFAAPDIMLGCTIDGKNSEVFKEHISSLIEEAPKWSRSKVSKLILFLKQNGFDNEQSNILLNILEEKINEEFRTLVEPDLWFSILESEKLINSNMPEQELKALFKNLKMLSSNWSDLIQRVEKDGVFLKLNSLQGTIGFSSIEDVFSILALKAFERNTIYEISKADAQLLRSEVYTDTSIPRHEVVKFVLVTIATVIVICLLLRNIQPVEEIKKLINISAPETIAELLNLIPNRTIVSIFFGLWNYNLWKELVRTRTLTFKRFIIGIPIAGKLLFKKQENEN